MQIACYEARHVWIASVDGGAKLLVVADVSSAAVASDREASTTVGPHETLRGERDRRSMASDWMGVSGRHQRAQLYVIMTSFDQSLGVTAYDPFLLFGLARHLRPPHRSAEVHAHTVRDTRTGCKTVTRFLTPLSSLCAQTCDVPRGVLHPW